MADQFERLKAALAERYSIEGEIGAGGMATVYLAEDLKHHRQVAIKVLRPELSVILGPERFLKEIEVTANLQHPNILPLYDSGQADSILYYVMPHIEGESLRTKLNRDKQLSVEEAVDIGKAVAAALDYAHRREVIHRDIKPENILLQSGQALVADFGIALAVSAAGGTRLTETGLSLGTPQYMSPEQATGDRELDARTDLYSLGAVVYEMLTGDPPHSGNTVQAIVAKVVSERPTPISQTRDLVPANVDAAVQRALAKAPADRFTSAADFAAALANPNFTLPTMAATTPAVQGPQLRLWRAIAVAMTLLAAVFGLLHIARPEAPKAVTRYGIAFPEGQELVDDLQRTFDVAPGGAYIVYVGPGEGGGQLWVKPRDQYDAYPLRGTDGARGPSVSPDGRWIAFTAGGQLRKVAVDGGASITLADSADMAFATPAAWLDDGTVVYTDQTFRLRRVSANGGESVIVQEQPSAGFLGAPTPLPDARGILFTVCDWGCRSVLEAWVLDLRTGEARRVLAGALGAAYASTGHLVFIRPDGAVLATEFDLEALDTAGAATPLLDDVKLDNEFYPDFTFSRDGTLLMMSGPGSQLGASREAVWVSREGEVTLVDPDWQFEVAANPGWSLSPDGTRLAIGLRTEAGYDIWVKELENGPLSRVTLNEESDDRPKWSADGRSIMFVSRRGEDRGHDLYVKRADGTGRPELLVSLDNSIWEAEPSANGEWIVVRTGGNGENRNVYGFRPARDSAVVPLLTGDYDEMAVALSPSARWLAYVSDESGRNEVYVRPFPDVEAGRWQVSVNGGNSPLWARSERELFYLSPAGEMIAAEVHAGSAFDIGERTTLFTLGWGYRTGLTYTTFDITPDDQQFIMVRQVNAQRPEKTPLILVENFFEELKEKIGN